MTPTDIRSLALNLLTEARVLDGIADSVEKGELTGREQETAVGLTISYLLGLLERL